MNAAQVGLTLWVLFLVSWWGAALWTAKAVSRGALWLRLAYFLGFALGFGLLFASPQMARTSRIAYPLGVTPLWPAHGIAAAGLLVAQLAAFAFALWARVHLGRLWSGMLTLRKGHRVVESGPYGLVRHPIYTAFIAGAWAFALIVATPAALAGAVVLTIVMTVKAKDEERLLRRELGEASYDAYAARVPMIVPFGWR